MTELKNNLIDAAMPMADDGGKEPHPNPDFVPLFSTNEIYRAKDNSICLEDELKKIEEDIRALGNNTGVTAEEVTTAISLAINGHTHNYDDKYAALDHDHNYDDKYIAKSLQFVNNTGGVEFFYGETSGKNLIDEIVSWSEGMHTAYSHSAVIGNPTSSESWRIMAHKTSNVLGWVMAFGSSGSVYSNYYNNGVWRGWKCLYDAVNAPLWKGESYLRDGQTIVPTKSLSECAHGWILLWSDYDPGTGANNFDYSTTMIPRFSYNGSKWTGQKWLCQVPRFANETGEGTSIKVIYVSDNQIVGDALNSVSPRNDIVLRAIYEF